MEKATKRLEWPEYFNILSNGRDCSVCDGTGILLGHRCNECDGSGWVPFEDDEK